MNNCGLNTSSSLATRHNPNRFGFCSRCSFGWRFVIFWILFGSNCKLTRSRSSLRSLFNLQFDLENNSKIWQSEFIEPTLNVKMNLFAFAETQLSRGGFAPPPKSQRSWGSASSTENWRVNVPCRVTLVAVEIVSQARGWYNYYRVWKAMWGETTATPLPSA